MNCHPERESFDDVRNAIDREKQLKRWRREKKKWPIERLNPEWKDLAADWYEAQGPSTAALVHEVNQRPRSDDSLLNQLI